MNPMVEAIERATFEALPPQAVKPLVGWLLGLDDGTVGRAHSTVPLAHEPAPRLPIDAVEAAYAARGLQAVFRIPVLAPFDAAAQELTRAGYTARQPTVTQWAELADLARLVGADVELSTEPDANWSRLFLGTTFDGKDASSRLAILRRSTRSVYASVREAGETVAVGIGCAAHGWCGIHGMRTAPDWRGRGCARAILGALARHGLARGANGAFLQVEQVNTTAQSVYRRAGFTAAWTYAYWRRGD